MRALELTGHLVYNLAYTLILQMIVTLVKLQEFDELPSWPKPAQITFFFIKEHTADVYDGLGKTDDVIYGCPFALVTFRQKKIPVLFSVGQ